MALKRYGFLAFGIFAYVAFLGTILYAIGFVGNFWHVLGFSGDYFRSVDLGAPSANLATGILIDGALLGVFALQHSVMARRSFKERWTRLIPAQLERSSFVLAASACLALLYWQWRPIGTTPIWDLSDSPLAFALVGIALIGWGLLVLATFTIDHFDLFGLKQVFVAFRGQPYVRPQFRTPGVYRAVRHPIYLGFLIAFWSTPVMTVGHLVFAIATTVYILLGIQLEERDLVHEHGDSYRAYRRAVPMLLPRPASAQDDSESMSVPSSHPPTLRS
jgi:protein-S-isoprenylcysteine O-methyltransferase Ste14